MKLSAVAIRALAHIRAWYIDTVDDRQVRSIPKPLFYNSLAFRFHKDGFQELLEANLVRIEHVDGNTAIFLTENF